MNEAEVRTMLNSIGSNYKGFIRPDVDKKSMLQNWIAAFEFVPASEGMRAARIYMQQNKFPPTIADVFELVPMQCMEQRRYNCDLDRLRSLADRLSKEAV